MSDSSSDLPYCVIGAGPSGLAATKSLLQAGIRVECLERQAQVGGNWNIDSAHSSVHQSTHLISSKRLSEFSDFRMPADYPHYPHHEQVAAYLRKYADEFDLYRHIRLGVTVTQVAPHDGLWAVQLADKEGPRLYRGVIIANGHHWDPRWPDFAADFAGEVVHAHAYRDPQCFRGKRVLVVGGGNSGCDIAVEAARHAQFAAISLRRGYYFFPKYLFGAPTDRCGETLHRWRLPRWLNHGITRLCLRVAVGSPTKYGLPRPDHPLFGSHPILNSQILHEISHGRLTPRGDVARVVGRTVHCCDGTFEEYDMLVCATGYHLSFPFLDADLRPPVTAASSGWALHVFHPSYNNLFVAGMIQPTGGIWPLAELQTQLVAHFIKSQSNNFAAANWFRHVISRESLRTRKKRYVDSQRHTIEVDYFAYRDRLRNLLQRFERFQLVSATPLRRRRNATGPASTETVVE